MLHLRNLDDLFILTLRRVYDVERRLSRALPRMAHAAEADDLKQAFEDHTIETDGHLERLDQIFALFDRIPAATVDDGLKGILKVTESAIKLDAKAGVRDSALLAVAQEAGRYEIALYGTLRTWSHILNRPEATQLLEWTLEEEKRADQRLTAIADALNYQTAAAGAS
jgi:ferritin-like metal-binding protein YciE